MSSDRWQRIQLLLEQALAEPAERRSAFVESSSAEAELRDEVLSLLAIGQHQRESPDPDDLVQELPTVWLSALAKINPQEALAIGKSNDMHTLPTEWQRPLLGPETIPRFAVGDQVGGRYVIRSLLGQGGMGDVYEAWDKELSIPVALKTLRFAGRSDEAQRRLKREGFLARSVWHPNVCRIYDVGRDGVGPDTTWFLTMELLRGETLSKRLREKGRLSPDQALAFAQQLIAGIGGAHQAGVVHRDFKTSNVMLVDKDTNEQAVIMDFGVARAVSRASGEENHAGRSDLIIGTPAYMAPEQLRGEDVGPAADIYSLGLVLHEMVIGSLPFADSSTIEMARKRLLEDPPSPRILLPELDERWEAVILRCLAREPELRFRRAEEIRAALAGELPADVITDSDLAPPPETLPVERDDFVGRDTDLEELAQKFAGGARLVTLVGAGGMGKTRLAVRYGSRTLSEWPGGVWFCDLTEMRDLNGVVAAVARSLGVQLGKADPVKQVGYSISSRGRCLLVMDNFEQVEEHGAVMLNQWLQRASEARFLVTSREKLSLGSLETVQAVESLPLDVGVELFAIRARRLRPGFILADLDAEAAREIVRLVDGMPLAIELAAARVRVMSAAEIVAQMKARFRLLTGGGTARHETLEVAIDGSWELLDPWEKAAWAQCSVFEGGFTLEAAEGVVDLALWPDAPSTVDVIQALVDKSLLRASVHQAEWERSAVARFSMYVNLQEYARMKLHGGAVLPSMAGTGATSNAEQRHGRWYARYGREEAIRDLDRTGGHRRKELEREIGNLITGCRRAMGHGDCDVAVALYQAIWSLIGLQGPYGIVLDLGHEMLAIPLGPLEKAHVLRVLGKAEMYAGHLEAGRAHAETALAIFHELGEPLWECAVIENLAILLLNQGRFLEARAHTEAGLAKSRAIGARRAEGTLMMYLGTLYRYDGQMEAALKHYEGALAIQREVDNRRLEGVVLSNLGIVHYDHGRLDEAQAHFQAALVIHRETGNRHSEGIVLGNLGNLDHDRGRFEEARKHYESALAIHREVGHRRFEGVSLNDLGNNHRAMGQLEAAQRCHESALGICREAEDRRLEGISLQNLGEDNHDQGRLDDALDCYEAALAISREVNDRRFEGIVFSRLGSLYLHQVQIEEARTALATAETIIREVEDPIELAILLCTRGELEWRAGNATAARTALDEAQVLSDRLQPGGESVMARGLTRLRRILDDDGQDD